MIVASLLTYVQAIILGLLQGVTELFPISSLGPSVLLPRPPAWNLHQTAPYCLPLLLPPPPPPAPALALFSWPAASPARA